MNVKQKEVHIFSNGSDHDYWRARNCDKCAHACHNNGQADNEPPVCRIEYSLMRGVVYQDVKDEALGNNGNCLYRMVRDMNGEKIQYVSAETARMFWV